MFIKVSKREGKHSVEVSALCMEKRSLFACICAQLLLVCAKQKYLEDCVYPTQLQNFSQLRDLLLNELVYEITVTA